VGPGIPLVAFAHWAHVTLYAITLQRIDWFCVIYFLLGMDEVTPGNTHKKGSDLQPLGLGPGIPLSASAHWAHVSLYAITLQRID
jgi:hypothetical protein